MNRQKAWRERKKALFMLDADAYQAHLQRTRERGKKWRDAHVYATRSRKRNGGMFKYRPQTRIPEWCRLGEARVDARSPFLAENITPSMRAYVRELVNERRAAR